MSKLGSSFGWRKEAVWVQFLVREDLLSSSVCTHRYVPLPAQIRLVLGFPGGSDGKESAFMAGDLSLSQEDPLEREGMATHSSILA